ncbi:TIGR02281 family clan AA aspartic protease [Novosphingobium flavum]|uniref:TIGR02281 family clan AA aspartic protease n=1 Tax=Novosphingobium flavum TaxID=1778672 RepID=A0A7X1FP29_9SPHN|nr:TIGR02281 family clan AA aspartic protease [Novosphingobium flavum]MBC2664353.1 TIGR02281 family clan AA aspartic protease [Novosphingobium flavum]
MKGFVALALAMVAVLLFAGEYAVPLHPLRGQAETAEAAPRPAPTTRSRFSGEALTLDRDASGQFHVDARVNGNLTKFLVDTGADTVALTVRDAEAAGIPVNPNAFIPILRTASGEGWGTLVKIDRIELGDTEVTNVQAIVARDLDVSLLGQTVLARMGRVELAGDRMVIEQKP